MTSSTERAFWPRLLLGHAGLDPQNARRHLDPAGYSGGDVANATYRNHGTHAEAIEIVFDPKSSATDLLEFFFRFTIHHPNRQEQRVARATAPPFSTGR